MSLFISIKNSAKAASAELLDLSMDKAIRMYRKQVLYPVTQELPKNKNKKLSFFGQSHGMTSLRRTNTGRLGWLKKSANFSETRERGLRSKQHSSWIHSGNCSVLLKNRVLLQDLKKKEWVRTKGAAPIQNIYFLEFSTMWTLWSRCLVRIIVVASFELVSEFLDEVKGTNWFRPRLQCWAWMDTTNNIAIEFFSTKSSPWFRLTVPVFEANIHSEIPSFNKSGINEKSRRKLHTPIR